MPQKVPHTDVSKETLIQLYRNMCLMRHWAEAVHRIEAKGLTRGFLHTFVGQEAVPTGVCAALRKDDYIVSTHRSHGHCIAKGMDMPKLMAELAGRATGVNRGRGGDMHIGDMSIGLLGTTAVVGGGVPLALGAALTAKLKGWERVAVAFFGDGATQQGVVHECLNLASIWKLPVVFVRENNRYAGSVPIEKASALRDVTKWASCYGIPAVTVDGMDVFAVYEGSIAMVEHARSGGGPTFIEAQTYRFEGATTWDTNTLAYRTKEEEDAYRQRDPLELFRRRVTKAKLLTMLDLDNIDKEAAERVKEAERFAEQSPLPDIDALSRDVYGTLVMPASS